MERRPLIPREERQKYIKEYVYRGFLLRKQRATERMELWLLNPSTRQISQFTTIVPTRVYSLDTALEAFMIRTLGRPGYLWKAVDGIPWEIHAIRDSDARLEAIRAYRLNTP